MFVPFQEYYSTVMNARAFVLGVFGVTSLCGLALAAVGLYGVLGHAVTNRMREFGIRMALGASGRDIVALVARDAAVMVLGGTGIGALLALPAGSLLAAFLYDVPSANAEALLLAESILLAVTCLACLGPLLRAVRSDPLEILRAP